jgi:peroxiredoxin
MLAAGDVAPNFTAKDVLTGEPRSLSDYAGQIVLLAFSGPSWCDPCKFEAPILEDVWQKFRGAVAPGVQFLMVSRNEFVESEYKKAAEKFGLTFPALHDATNTICQGLYDTAPVPTLYVITPNGLICSVQEGVHGPEQKAYDAIEHRLTACGAKPFVDLYKWKAMLMLIFGAIGGGPGLGIGPGGDPIPIDPEGPLARMRAEEHDLYTHLAIAKLSRTLTSAAAAHESELKALRAAEKALGKLTRRLEQMQADPAVTAVKAPRQS